MQNNILERGELKEVLEEIEYYPEIRASLEGYLHHYINTKDLELVILLLEAGADPNHTDPLHCYLLHLLHEYQSTKTTAGELVLDIMLNLLESGADPNRVAENNLRAYDYAVAWKCIPVAQLLEKYGVDTKLREVI